MKTFRKHFWSSELRYTVGVLLIGLFIASCSSSKESSDKQDSSSDSSNAISSEMELTAPENLAPGTAQVRLTVKEVTSEREEQVWVTEIKEILGYGSSTPPLGVGENLSVNTNNYFTNVNADPRELASRDELICLIRHQQQLAGFRGSNWSLVKVFEQLK